MQIFKMVNVVLGINSNSFEKNYYFLKWFILLSTGKSFNNSFPTKISLDW